MTELEQLRDRVAELEEALGLTLDVPETLLVRFTKTERKIIGILLKRGIVPCGVFYSAIYGGNSNPPEMKIIEVYMCGLRKKLRDFGVAIHTKYSEGYFITKSDKDKINAALQGVQT